MEANVFQHDAGSLQQFADLALGDCVVDDEFNPFVTREVADDFCVDPGDGLELAWPIAAVVRPR